MTLNIDMGLLFLLYFIQNICGVQQVGFTAPAAYVKFWEMPAIFAPSLFSSFNSTIIRELYYALVIHFKVIGSYFPTEHYVCRLYFLLLPYLKNQALNFSYSFLRKLKSILCTF